MKPQHLTFPAGQYLQGANGGNAKGLQNMCAMCMEHNNVYIWFLRQRNSLKSPTAQVSIQEEQKPDVPKPWW
jgi:hypothetical protein